jgi:DNA helicase HerA-like ATPase
MQIWAKRRQAVAVRDRTPVCLIVDEFHNFLSHSTAETLDQFGRKFGLFMVLAHQHIQQITDREIRGSVLANTANKIAGMSNAETRQALAREMNIEPDDLASLKPGHFVARLGNGEPFPFYARMMRSKKWPKWGYHESKNGPELVDGWDGLDAEQDTPQGTESTKTPRKGLKPKFDI